MPGGFRFLSAAEILLPDTHHCLQLTRSPRAHMSQAILFLSVPARQQGAYTKNQQQQQTKQTKSTQKKHASTNRRLPERLPGCGVGKVARAVHAAALSSGPQPLDHARCCSGAAPIPRGRGVARCPRGLPPGPGELPPPAAPAARPSLNLCPRHGAASRGKGAFFSLGVCVPFLFSLGGGLKNSSAVGSGHRARTWQASAKQRRCTFGISIKTLVNLTQPRWHLKY